MTKSETDIVREVLEAALRGLREDAGDGAPNPDSIQVVINKLRSSERSGNDAPVILILSVDSKERSKDPISQQPAVLGDPDRSERPKDTGVGHFGRKVSHPELERFTIIEAPPTTGAPKTCFMEPGRACVNSGACEMRGF